MQAGDTAARPVTGVLGPHDPDDGVLPTEPVDLIAAAVRACPAVAGLHAGQFGQVTTDLPGRRVVGVAVSVDEIVVGVAGRYPASVAEIAAQVRAAVATVVPGVQVTVNVEDLLLCDETPNGA